MSKKINCEKKDNCPGKGTRCINEPFHIMKSVDSFSILRPSSNRFIPPDPICATGPTVFVVMVNSTIGIYNKCTGSLLFQQGLSHGPSSDNPTTGFWDSVGSTTLVGEPWVVYDIHECRFIAIAVEISDDPSTSNIYLAVSKDNSPKNGDDWFKYKIFRTDTSPQGNPTFPDYPKLGYNDKAYYITSNIFDLVTEDFVYTSIFAINKKQVLNGEPIVITKDIKIFNVSSIFPLTVYDKKSPMYFVESPFLKIGNDTLRVYQFKDQKLSAVSIKVPPYEQPKKIPQPDPLAAPLDAEDSRIMSGCLRNNRIWTAHSISDATMPTVFSTVRWYEFDITKFPKIKLSQLQTIVPTDQDNLWMSHIDVNENNDMALGFSVCGKTRFASIGFTGRTTNDDPNTTRPYAIAKAGVDNYVILDDIDRNRWGDYTGLSYDPVNNNIFWLFNEYAALKSSDQSGVWATNFTAFTIDNCCDKSIKQSHVELPSIYTILFIDNTNNVITFDAEKNVFTKLMVKNDNDNNNLKTSYNPRRIVKSH